MWASCSPDVDAAQARADLRLRVRGIWYADRMHRWAAVPGSSFTLLVALAVVSSCNSPSPRTPTNAPTAPITLPNEPESTDPSVRATEEPGPDGWKSAPRTHVVGDELLDCTARELPGWVEVTCDENGFLGGVERILIDPKGREAKVESKRLVFRWHEGSSVVATFDWSTPVVFEAVWPPGQGEPKPIGRFRDVPDFPAKEVATFICSCAPLFFGQPAPPDCNLASGFGGALECLRAHFDGKDCQLYRECITMEPGSYGECAPNEQHTGACPSCRCAPQCGEGKPDCPPGTTCEPGLHDAEKKECVFE